jgi:tripartite-type tricarboxylate transporter receptor subunit TctC
LEGLICTTPLTRGRDVAGAFSFVVIGPERPRRQSLQATTVGTYASSGNGSTEHVSGELFKMMTGVKIVHVPYRGAAPAIGDLLGGQVQVMFDVLPTSIEYIRAGNLRALAVTTAIRSEAVPDLPMLSEFVRAMR